MAPHLLRPVTIAAILGLSAGAALAQFDEQSCKPYTHGEARNQTPTMFCQRKEDAIAYIDLMERRRTEKISLEEGKKELAAFRETRECAFVTTSHVSRRTLHRAVEKAPYCQKYGFAATKWPSLVEAELTGDGTSIWVLTHALVPSVEK